MEFAEAINEYHAAAAEFIRGDPGPYEAMFSHADDVTLANPFGPPARGWQDVRATMDRAATLYGTSVSSSSRLWQRSSPPTSPISWRSNGSKRR